MPGTRVLEYILHSQLHSRNPEQTSMAKALSGAELVSSELYLNSAVHYLSRDHK